MYKLVGAMKSKSRTILASSQLDAQTFLTAIQPNFDLPAPTPTLYKQHAVALKSQAYSLQWDLADEHEIESYRRHLRDNSPGIDNIPNSVLRGIMDTTPRFLTTIVNRCLTNGVFPSDLKIGLVKAVPKPLKPDGSPQVPRPITLLPTLGKVIERSILTRLKREMQHRSITLEGQFGARAGVSAADALNATLRNFDLPGMFISLDLSKAFDRMSQARLLYTMNELGFSTSAQQLVQSYLRDRVIYTQVDQERAGPFYPENGGPQ